MVNLGGRTILVAAAAMLVSCRGRPLEEPLQTRISKERLRWEASDNPSILADDMVYTLSTLPVQGEVTDTPWPGSYWPTYRDSVNIRWAGEEVESATEKYGRAFNVPDMESRVSEYSGILSQNGRTTCSEDSQCDASRGEVCAKRRGANDGFCIPTWFGLCHAWAPAAILEPEPIREVTSQGVTFEVNDLKALMTLAYNESTSRFLSLRCNESNSAGEIEYDPYGRPTGSDTECGDTNAGTFHVVIANYLGTKKLSLVEDRIFDDQVWNQPLRGFEVVEQIEVGARDANKLIGAVGPTVTKTGVVLQSTWAHLGNYAVSAGQRISIAMSGLGDADLYVRFGAQPTTTSYACRPYGEDSNETCELVVPEGATRVHVSVRGYAVASLYTVNMILGDQGLPTYQFNPDAVRFYYVKTNLRYIYESGLGEDGNLSGRIEDYTGTDTYEYVLELDRDDQIIGGEWLNDSKTNHPDFLWLPTGRSATGDSPIDYGTVKALFDQSVSLAAGEKLVTTRQAGTLAEGAWAHYGPFEVSSGSLRAVMTGSGDADLYVRRGAAPTSEAYDCRPYAGGSDEACKLTGPGAIYVSVAGYGPTSDFTLDISYVTMEE